MKQSNQEKYTGEIIYEPTGRNMMLCRSNFTLHQDYILDAEHNAGELFQLGFCLEGELNWQYPNLATRDFILSENQSLVQYGNIERSVSTFFEGQTCQGLNFMLEKERFETLISCFQCEGAVTDLQRDISPKVYSISPKIRLILGQIYSCDICGSLRSTYLEGKSLELLAVYFDEVVCQADASLKHEDISHEDYICLLKAKDIICRRYAHPLTIAMLARETCLNEYKLKWGFKHCFGATILEYIVQKRMDMAELLLTDGKHKVKDVAWMVGYAKPSHFIDTFKKHHGITPGEFAKS